jgi:hypothetical protein
MGCPADELTRQAMDLVASMIVTLDQFPIVDVGCSGRILLGCRRSDEETLLAVIVAN